MVRKSAAQAMPSATCVFTQRPDNNGERASETFLQESLAQDTNLILRNKVSAVGKGPGFWQKQGGGRKLSPLEGAIED